MWASAGRAQPGGHGGSRQLPPLQACPSRSPIGLEYLTNRPDIQAQLF